LVEQRYHVAKDAAKLRLRDVLLKLLNAGEVQAQRFDDVDSGETVSLYFAKSINENEGPLHRWMLGQVVEGCKGIIVHVASSGESLPDIETGRAYIEVETGLKRRVDDLQERITKFTAKPFVVLVPNEAVAQEYRRKLVSNDRITVKTLREFLRDSRA
jgi:hypothetical protein